MEIRLKMLKIGKVINPDSDIITLHLEEFSIANMEWLMPVEVKISLRRIECHLLKDNFEKLT